MMIGCALLYCLATGTTEMQDDPVRSGGSQPPVGVPGGDSYCTPTHKCMYGEGDCDVDADCADGLGCGYDNCVAMNGADSVYIAGQDCCEPREIGQLDYCVGIKCGYGEGDCDSDSECAEGLVCGTDNCRAMHTKNADYINPTADCCDYATPVCLAKSCGIDEGVCQEDAQCVGGLKCSFSCTKYTGQCCGCSESSGVAFVNTVALTKTAVPSPTVHQPLTNIPDSFFGGNLYETTDSIPSGSDLYLHCCGDTDCSFYVVVYHCPPCSNTMNGGISASLLSANWRPGSCSPKVHGLPTVTYYKSISAGTSEHHTFGSDAIFLFVFSKPTAATDGDWCPARPGQYQPKGPARSCIVCPNHVSAPM
eukprot:TRINITY_DN4035_c0_g1_i1.p1 TRINITY_DN4035_c0_g1~~TRINITY_DN4035_c0_g1_i1.p1  ORF type:complete len:364 (+),score=38.14 TRINITY_DN4035_c0_g1_i1:55-1146(+)